MYAYTYTLTPMIPLRKDCDGYAVARKFELTLNLLDLTLTYSLSYLGDRNTDTLLEWISEALTDIRDHKDVLAESLADEVEAVEQAVFACFQISRYERQAKDEPPILRGAAKEAAEYWRAVARESEPPTPRTERVVNLLRERYRW